MKQQVFLICCKSQTGNRPSQFHYQEKKPSTSACQHTSTGTESLKAATRTLLPEALHYCCLRFNFSPSSAYANTTRAALSTLPRGRAKTGGQSHANAALILCFYGKWVGSSSHHLNSQKPQEKLTRGVSGGGGGGSHLVQGVLYCKADHAMICSKRKLMRPLEVQDDGCSLLPAPKQLESAVSGCTSVVPSQQHTIASSEAAQTPDTGCTGGSNGSSPPSLPIIHNLDSPQLLEASTGSRRQSHFTAPKQPGGSLGHRADSSASSHSQLKEETSSVKNASNRVC